MNWPKIKTPTININWVKIKKVGEILIGLIIVLVIIGFVIAINFGDIKPIARYSPKYELSILRQVNSLSYKCDSFSIDNNIYHLYDTNKVETYTIVIPNNEVVEIKNIKNVKFRK